MTKDLPLQRSVTTPLLEPTLIFRETPAVTKTTIQHTPTLRS